MSPADASVPRHLDGMALKVTGLRKTFDDREVIRGLDWHVPSGRVVGLLGRNGAGKTTLLRCLLGLSPHDDGEVELLGEPMREPGGERLHRIGFVPQSFDLFPWMRVRAFLEFTAAFYARWDASLVERLLAEWTIEPEHVIGQLSQGQRQKLAIVRALAPDPDLLLLDEPVASLDPQARRAFMDELMQLVQRPGKTVVFSTHITADLERAGADIALLRDGRIALEAPLATLRRRIRRVELHREGGFEQPPVCANALRSTVDEGVARYVIDDDSDEAVQALAARESARLTVEPMSLEDLFVELA